MGIDVDQLPVREGPSPEVAGPMPHSQATQNAPRELQEQVVQAALSLPGVSEADSLVSVPGARAFVLDEQLARGPDEAFQAGREFAHVHPAHDGSLHMTLPEPVAR